MGDVISNEQKTLFLCKLGLARNEVKYKSLLQVIFVHGFQCGNGFVEWGIDGFNDFLLGSAYFLFHFRSRSRIKFNAFTFDKHGI